MLNNLTEEQQKFYLYVRTYVCFYYEKYTKIQKLLMPSKKMVKYFQNI